MEEDLGCIEGHFATWSSLVFIVPAAVILITIPYASAPRFFIYSSIASGIGLVGVAGFSSMCHARVGDLGESWDGQVLGLSALLNFVVLVAMRLPWAAETLPLVLAFDFVYRTLAAYAHYDNSVGGFHAVSQVALAGIVSLNIGWVCVFLYLRVPYERASGLIALLVIWSGATLVMRLIEREVDAPEILHGLFHISASAAVLIMWLCVLAIFQAGLNPPSSPSQGHLQASSFRRGRRDREGPLFFDG